MRVSAGAFRFGAICGLLLRNRREVETACSMKEASMFSSGAVKARSNPARTMLGAAGLMMVWAVSTGPAGAEDYTLRDVTISGALGTYTMPEIIVSGANMPVSELGDALASDDFDQIWAVLSQFSADEVVIPTLSFSQDFSDVEQSGRYDEVRLADVDMGRIGEFSAAGGAFVALDDREEVSGTFGRMTAQAMDLPWVIRFYTETAGDGDNPYRPAYEAFSVADMTLTDGESVEIDIEMIEGASFAMRLLDQPFARTIEEMAALEDGPVSTEDEVRALRFVVDMLESFRFSGMEAHGMRMASLDPQEPFAMTIGTIGLGGDEEGGFSGFYLDEMVVTAEDARIAIAGITSEGFSFAPVIEGLRDLADDPQDELSPDAMQRLVPVFGTFTMNGLEASIPPEPGSPAIEATLGRLLIVADEPFDGLPTNMRFALDNLLIDLPPGTGEDSVEQLRALGYERLDISTNIAARWNETAREVVISDISFSGEDMGAISLRGVIGGIGEEAFSGDETTRLMAMMGATAKNAQLMIEDRGIAERLLAMQAAMMGTDPAAARQQLGALTQLMLPEMLGGTPEARQLANELSRFVQDPGELEISVVSRRPDGVPILEITTAPAPAALLEQFDVTIEAR